MTSSWGDERLFALHDSKVELRTSRGAFEISPAEASALNAEGFGIFWVPNAFTGRRVVSNLTRIRYWYAEVDAGSKPEALARLRRAALLPSMVIESARGYHIYFAVRGKASPENWKRIVRKGLVPALKSDPKATDLLRLLRAPGYMHMKDPANPFKVETVWEFDASYSEEQMLRAFPEKKKTTKAGAPGAVEGDGFWSRVAALDAREALPRLNGHPLQNGEHFQLSEQSNGNWNVVRPDGRSTSVFVDASGRLGNVAGGSSVAAWLAYYGHDWATIARGLKEVFPELGEHE